LYLYVKKSPSPDVRNFMDYVVSTKGEAIIAQHHLTLRQQ
jgi:ABC-type phosphate transport system substrate-binding protein